MIHSPSPFPAPPSTAATILAVLQYPVRRPPPASCSPRPISVSKHPWASVLSFDLSLEFDRSSSLFGPWIIRHLDCSCWEGTFDLRLTSYVSSLPTNVHCRRSSLSLHASHICLCAFPLSPHLLSLLSARHSFKTTISHRFTDHVGAAPQNSSEASPTTIRPSLFQRLAIRPTLLLNRARSKTRSPARTPASLSSSPHLADEDPSNSVHVFAAAELFNNMIPSSLTVTPPAPPSKRQRFRESRPFSSRAGSSYREADDCPPPSPGLRIPAFLNQSKAG